MSHLQNKHLDWQELLQSLNKKDLLEISSTLVSAIKHKVGENEFDKAIKLTKVPISIFCKELSALEAMVKYLKENLKLRYNEIAKLLNRDERNIWTTYKNASKKMPNRLKALQTHIYIPVTLLHNKKLSVLENIVSYLKENKNLTYKTIAGILKRDNRTIWTVYHRSQIKKKIN